MSSLDTDHQAGDGPRPVLLSRSDVWDGYVKVRRMWGSITP